jgi:redox-sensitive bicupin YhaK (pirin superfamily)
MINHTAKTDLPLRKIERLIKGVPTQDGAGVKLTRVLSSPALQKRLDPFLMMDHFGSDQSSDYIAGFPDHPHRGFETITYMLEGRMRHQDSRGHEGLLETGGVQWMTAGRGIVHSEMPEQIEGKMEGFQLWLNLPAKDKMREPWYRDIPSSQIPEFSTKNGVWVRVIAGESHHVQGAIFRSESNFPTNPLYLDIHFPTNSGETFFQPINASYHAFLYVYQGSIGVLDQENTQTNVPEQHMAILSNEGEGIHLKSNGAARVLLIAGNPLKEPIAQYGPFVMNTQEEIFQTIKDFREGNF